MNRAWSRTAAAAVVALGALLAVAAPLWTYAVTLALFGLPHVAVELRYVDERFGARLGRRLLCLLALLLSGIVLLRVAGASGVGLAAARAMLEFGLGALLVAVVLPRLLVRGPLHAAIGSAVLLLACFAAATAPLLALVLFAVLHNLTPVAFLAERLRGDGRRSAMRWCVFTFGVVPVLIATGLLPALLLAAGLEPAASGPPGVGDLDLHLGAFVPATWHHRAFAPDLFAAATFLQCMHHAVVLLVLPRLGGGDERAGAQFAWPSRTVFAVAVGGCALLLLLGYGADFGATRSIYGIFAAVHAWIEIPVLLLAVTAGRPAHALTAAAEA